MNLQQVLADCANLNVVVVRLADAPEEMNGVGIAQVPVNRLEHIAFRLEDLRLGIGLLRALE